MSVIRPRPRLGGVDESGPRPGIKGESGPPYVPPADPCPPQAVPGGQWTPVGDIATPFLVAPLSPLDNGDRVGVLHSEIVANNSIDVRIVTLNEPGTGNTSFELSCEVCNLGAGGCFAGWAEFYICKEIYTYSQQELSLPAAAIQGLASRIGYVGFQIPAARSVRIVCPRLWFAKFMYADVAVGIIVQVYDLWSDRLVAPFDAFRDCHVARNDVVMDRLLRNAPAPSAVLVPYGSAGFLYRLVGQGQSVSFELPDSDESVFASDGLAPFGSGSAPAVNCPLDASVKTAWPLNTDILLRKHFDCPVKATNVLVAVGIDNDVQVFVNGVEVSNGLRSHEGCAELDSFVFPVPDGALNKGSDNVIAVRGRDRGVIGFLDVEVRADIAP